MKDTAKQTFELLENLLEWSRIQTGKLNPNFKNVTPSELFSEIKTISQSIAGSKGITIAFQIKDNHYIIADHSMILTVIRNLVTNALKFTYHDGKVTVTSEIRENEMLFTVADTGIGIAEEHLNKLFKVDSKLSKRGTADEKGTGLGLILCKEFIDMHGGKIWVESTLGKGSCFMFTVPLYQKA